MTPTTPTDTNGNRELTKALDKLQRGKAREGLSFAPNVVNWLREAWVLTSLEFGAQRIRSGYLLAALMSELLPAATRATGLGLCYNIGVTLFGGMGPVIMTWLGTIAVIGDLSPAYYLTFVGILSLSALITIRRTAADQQGV